MRIEIIGIGDELLAGFTVNTNAATIGRAFLEAGYPVTSQSVIPDERSAIQKGISRSCLDNDLVICTGGLGPTLDDNTRQAVAELVGSEFVYHEEVAAKLKQRLGEKIISLEDQATIPKKADPLHNPVGTAPGLVFRVDTAILILLPGVPVEMEAILFDQVLPLVEKEFGARAAANCQTLHFVQIAEAQIDQKLRPLAQKHPSIKVGIYPHLGLVTVRLSGDGDLSPFAKELREAFSEHFIDMSAGDLPSAVHETFLQKGLTLSTAESCTGGSIASLLTRRAGASEYFLGGVVVYSNEAKETLLGVSEETLIRHGAVSEPVVEEMVAGVTARLGTDFGIAVSGIAGPSGGTPEKPVGTVCIAVGRRGHPPHVTTIQAKGNRAAVIQRTINWALADLLRLL